MVAGPFPLSISGMPAAAPPQAPHPHTLSSHQGSAPRDAPHRGFCPTSKPSSGVLTTLSTTGLAHFSSPGFLIPPPAVLQSSEAPPGLWLGAPSQLPWADIPPAVLSVLFPATLSPQVTHQASMASWGLRNSGELGTGCHGPQAPGPGGIHRGSWGSRCSGYGA